MIKQKEQLKRTMKKCHMNSLTSSHKRGLKPCHINLPFLKIKMLLSINTRLLATFALISCLLLPLVYGEADSDATASIMDDLLTGQNRAAKPEPFLDRIAALFGGGIKNSNKGRKRTSLRNTFLILTFHYQIIVL